MWTVRISGDVAESFSTELQTVKISWDVAESFLIELRTVKISGSRMPKERPVENDDNDEDENAKPDIEDCLTCSRMPNERPEYKNRFCLI